MSVITKVLKQKAVYWAPVPDDKFNEAPRFDDYGRAIVQCDPVELNVRWEDMQEEVKTADGGTYMAKSKVMVSDDVALGGFLMLGELSDIQNNDVPLDNPNTFEIIKFDKIPNFRNTEFLRVAFL